MPEVEIVWPKEALAGIEKQMRRVQGMPRKDAADAITMAAYYLARSASARTKSEPKKRKNLRNKETSGRFNSDRYPYYREIWVDGPNKVQNWYIEDKLATEYQDVKNAGLAKKSWSWMSKMVRRGGSNFASSVERRMTAFAAEIELRNKLSYIKKALKDGDQNSLLREAAIKATASMTKVIDKRMKGLIK